MKTNVLSQKRVRNCWPALLGITVLHLCFRLTAWGQSGTPINPTPINPTPINPTPINPTPIAPTPIAPTPINPTPIAPTPIAPTPIAPTPITPTPIQPTQILTPPEPQLPDALDSDGDGFLDFAENWYGSDPHNALDKPTDMTPAQANFNPAALEWYKAGVGRLNVTPNYHNLPPQRPGAVHHFAGPHGAAGARPPGLSGGQAALIGVGVAGAVVAGVGVAALAGKAIEEASYKCSEGYSLCTDGACCRTHNIHGAWGAYHGSNGSCYPSAESAAQAAMHGIGIVACADERQYARAHAPTELLRHALHTSTPHP